jgi:hypothetical protein
MAENRNLFRARRPAFGERSRSRACLIGAALAMMCALPAAQAQDAGLKGGASSLAAGKYDTAVRQLSATVNSEGASRSDAARALYLRGIAYRKLGQPAKAISDLGAAIWLGLSGSDKVRALVNRGLAFQAAGLSKQVSAELSLARDAGSSSEVEKLISEDGGSAAGSAAIAAFDTQVSPGEDDAASSSGASRAKPEPIPGLGASVGESPPPATRTADASANWTVTEKSSPTQSSPSPKASSGWDTSVSGGSTVPQSGNRVSRWFGSITDSFGSSSESAPAPAAEPAPAPAPAAPKQRAATAPSAGSWATETQTAAAPSSSEGKSWAGRLFSRTAEAEPAAAPAPATATGGGSYRLQLATSNSESEAKALWQKVSRQNQQVASASPQIEKVEIGNFGTFYSLRIGPFSSRDESTKVCNALKRNGVDCSLVTPDME